VRGLWLKATNTERDLNEHEQVSTIPPPQGGAFERHYSIKQLAEWWGLGDDVVRRIFAHEEGVLRIAHPETLHKRGYVTLRVPESVARRVHRRLTEPRSKRLN
jgi:hypothetical protein